MKRAWLLGIALLSAQQSSLAAIFGEDVDDKARQEIADTRSELLLHLRARIGDLLPRFVVHIFAEDGGKTCVLRTKQRNT